MESECGIENYDTDIRPIVDGILEDIEIIDGLLDASHISDFDHDEDVSRAESDIKEWLSKTEMEPTYHRCEHCNGVFKKKESYKRHISTNRKCASIRASKGIPVWLDLHHCGICDKTFTRESSLLSHWIVYHTN